MLSTSVAIAILGTTAVAMVGLGAATFFIDRKSPSNQLFSMWMLSLSAWAIALMAFFATDSRLSAVMWMRASYAMAILGIVSFFYFATQFPRATRLSPAVHVTNVLSLMLFVAAIMSTDLIVIDVTGKPFASNVVISTLGWVLYAAYLLLHFLSAHVILFMKYRKAKDVERIQLRYVVWSVFIGGEVFGVVFNLLLPSPIFQQWNFIWLGPAATAAVIVPFVAYAVTKHNLFNVKGIVTEIMVFFTIIFTIINAILSDSASEFIFMSIIAVGVSVLGTVLIFRVNEDERRRKELERLADELARANEDLMELDRLKSEFVSIASHQLRTPVSVMKGYLSLIAENAYGPVSPELRDKVQHMYRMNDRLGHLITNMLNVSRIEKEKIDYSCGSFDLLSVIDEVIDEMTYKASEKKLFLKFERPAEGQVRVFADQEKVSEVLSNLIDNATKYSTKGGVSVSAEIRADEDDVLVRVRDTGIGIPDDAMSKLFSKFYRPKREANLATQGTGLGLYICRVFVEGMGGTIEVESSSAEEGTTFVFSVPVVPRGACAE